MSSSPRLCHLHDPAPLEDDLSYVWRKAMRGMQIDSTELASLCHVKEDAITQLLAGNGDASLAREASAVLHLNATAVARHNAYQPCVPSVQGVYRLQLPFENDTVNAWLIQDHDHAILFDTGFEKDSAWQLLYPMGDLNLELMITHEHRDHVGGISSLLPHVKKQHSLSYGQSMQIGALRISCIDLSGHCIPSYGYQINGLSHSLCVVGDALFAGSIGGCADSFAYQMALRNLREHVMSLPDDTILLPGHGPATTVGQEKRSNPFLAH